MISLSHASRLLFAALTIATAASAATTVTTVPVGYLKAAIAGGAPSAPVNTSFGVPLDEAIAPPAGIRAGRIESFTATTLTHSGGGWTGNLANPAAPWLVRLTSGPAAGKMFDVTANTSTTLTLSGDSLTTLGLTAGVDTFELVPMDTLLSLFGTDTLVGGANSGVADLVQIRSATAWVSYFYDPALGYWRTTTTAATNSNHVAIRPGSGVIVTHRAAPLSLIFTGRLPVGPFRMPVRNSGATVLHTGFPTDTTLGSFAVQTLVPGWRGGTTPNNADTLAVYNGSLTTNYLFNGSSWQQVGVAGVNKNSTPIPAGALIMLQRSVGAGTTDLVRLPPYSL